jgi:Ca2+-binding RTX toxin-like protein
MAVNDNFTNGTLLSGLAPNGQGSNIGATPEVGEPVQSGITNSVWWSWTAPNDGTFTIDTKNSNFDTFLSVFTGSALNNLSLIGYNDDVNYAAGDLTSLLNLNVTAGTTYQIAVDGYQGYTGNIQLNIVPLVINGTPNSDSFRTTAYPETINGLSGDDDIYGDAGNDILNGNDGDDLLLGETGNDILTGGIGSDEFTFALSSLPAAGVDTITDFGLYSDKVILSKPIFSSLETNGGNPTMGGNLLQAGDFSMINVAATSEVAIAGTSLNEIVYNVVTGNLFYNPNNSMPDFGAGGGKFATIVGSPDYFSNGNFRVISV